MIELLTILIFVTAAVAGVMAILVLYLSIKKRPLSVFWIEFLFYSLLGTFIISSALNVLRYFLEKAII